MKKTFLFILIISTLLFGACSNESTYVHNEDRKTVQLNISEEEAIAKERIRNDYNYQNYGGENLTLNQVEEIGDGYRLTYTYDINQNAPSDKVTKIEASVIVINGRASNYTHTEIIEN